MFSYTPRFIKRWLMLVIIITVLTLFVYVLIQQNIRLSANEPQIRIARQISTAIAAGAAPDLLIPTESIEIDKSLSPYVIVFDNDGDPMVSSGFLNGEVPVPPKGVFEYARSSGEDRITWQPMPEVRSAMVMVRHDGQSPGFVLSGRSLKVVELQEYQLALLMFSIWVVAIVLAFTNSISSIKKK